MKIERLLVLFVTSCIFMGDIVLRILLLPFLLLERVIKTSRTISLFVLEKFFRLITVGIWHIFKRPKRKKEVLFSVNYYLFFYRIKYFVVGFLIASVLFFVKTSIDFIGALPNPAL